MSAVERAAEVHSANMVALVLGGHQFAQHGRFVKRWECNCGWIASTSLVYDRIHHQAEALAAAGLLRTDFND